MTDIRRTVGTRTIDAGPAHTVVISRVYDTPVDDLWDACTSAERIERWMLPVHGDLRLGGRYQLEGNAGGVVERCDPPHSFAATWEFDGTTSWIEVRLTAVDGGTQLEIEHITGPEGEDHWTQYGPGAVGIGWELALTGLHQHLGGPPPVLNEQVTIDSGRAWQAAHEASGVDADVAEQSADHTIAAYTGAEE